MNTILNIILCYLRDIHTLLTELLALSRSFKQFTEFFLSDTTDFRILRSPWDQSNHKPVLRDNAHVCDRLGVSLRTVRRFIARGELKIYETVHKRNYYRDEDVEALRQRYRGY